MRSLDVRVGPPDPVRLPSRASATVFCCSLLGAPARSGNRAGPSALRPAGVRAMMKLMSNPLSPYGRKVKLAIAMKGLRDAIEIVATDTNPGDNAALNTANPLGKIPCLV